MRKLIASIMAFCLVFSMIPSVLAFAWSNPLSKDIEAMKSKEEATYVLYEDFEEDIEGWLMIDADGDEQNWVHKSSGSSAYSGSKYMASYSWDGETFTPDNWLISPQFTPVGDMELSWYSAPYYVDKAEETYSVYISTTGTEIADFDTLLFTETPTGRYARQAIDLSEYDGQQVYIAFRHHNSTQQYAVKIDLVTVGTPFVLTPNEELGLALNAGNDFDFYDDSPLPFEVVNEDGISYVKSTNQGIDRSHSTFYTVIDMEEGETLQFDYKVSSQFWGDMLVLYVNDEMVYQASGPDFWETWATHSYTALKSGEHKFVWSYEKDMEIAEGEDIALIDNVRLASEEVNYDINEALNVDGGTLEFVNDGVYKWKEVEIDGRLAAMSTNQGIDDSVSAISTTVTLQPKEIFAFDIKVSSEAGYDAVFIAIDGEQVYLVTGEFGWETVVFENDSTNVETFTFTFSYEKDYSQYEGADSAWLDNVYAGPRPELEGIEFTEESVFLPVGFSTRLYLVPTPTMAQITDVTYASDNEAVATVDNYGNITGEAVGTAKITATSGEFTAEITVTVSTDNYAFGNTIWHDNTELTGWTAYELEKQQATFLSDIDEVTANTFALTLVNNIYYGVTLDGSLYTLDTTTFIYELSNPVISDVAMLDLTYNPAIGEFIGLGADLYDKIALYLVDFENSSVTKMVDADFEGILYTLAANLDGELYTIAAGTGDLFKINASTGELTLVGNTGTLPNFVQSMAFDHNTGDLYWALFQDEVGENQSLPTAGSLVKVDPETAFTQLVIPGIGEVVGFSVMYEYSEVERIPVTGITLEERYEWVTWGDTIALNASVIPENANIWRILFTSSNEDVAVVNDEGVVTVVGRGVAEITATTLEGGFSEVCTIYSSYQLNTLLVQDFENELDGWEIVDNDGDGQNWFLNASRPWSPAVSGDYFLASNSIDDDTYAGLTPDNWLISPVITIEDGTNLSWYDIGINVSMNDENYSVYITSNPDAETLEEEFGTLVYNGIPEEATWTQRTVDLSEYAGKEVRIAFRHHVEESQYRLGIDLIEATQLDLSTPKIGDVNVDEKFNTGDAVMILRNLVVGTELSDDQKFAADMNGDGLIRTGDATKVLIILVHV